MKKMVLFVGIAMAISCADTKKTSQQPATGGAISIQGKLFAAVYQQLAGEYYALCVQAYNTAHFRLDLALEKGFSRPAAIVTDIDETVLDNSPNAVHQALKGKDFDQEAWLEWTGMGKADTVPGALGFLKYASSKNAEIFYISNRSEAERNATLHNLQHFGFPNADSAHLMLRKNTSGKEDRRQTVLADHEIVLLIGDNLSDFSKLFDKQPSDKRQAIAREKTAEFGNRFIVIPNPGYGDWESALYQYNYSLTPQQKDSAIIKNLKRY